MDRWVMMKYHLFSSLLSLSVLQLELYDHLHDQADVDHQRNSCCTVQRPFPAPYRQPRWSLLLSTAVFIGQEHGSARER